jgi:hypothetical protein
VLNGSDFYFRQLGYVAIHYPCKATAVLAKIRNLHHVKCLFCENLSTPCKTGYAMI